MKSVLVISMVLSSVFLKASPFLQNAIHEISYHVDPIKGKDAPNASGSIKNPFKTIQQAQKAVKAINQKMTSDIVVYLHGGTYNLSATLTFSKQDGGYNGFNVIYKAYQNEKPILSGGKPIVGWQLVKGKNYYKANAATALGFAPFMRNIFVNGRRALQARSSFITPHHFNYDDPNTSEFRDGYFVKTSDLKNYSNIKDIRLFQCGAFKHIEIPIEKVFPVTSTESALAMKQPSFYNWTNTYTYVSFANPEPIQLVNAFEELDEPGEFYHNRSTGTIYYYPRKEEDLRNAKVIAPVTETLLKIKGDTTAFVNHLQFEGISFQYGNWTTWATKEIGRSQADLYADYTAIEGQIQLQYTSDISFKGCRFEHLLGSGIYLPDNNNHTIIQGNVFNDITAAAVLIGKDMKPSAIVNNNTLIDNNVVRSIGADFYQSSGIYANVSNNLTITHNDVADVPYFGINQRYADVSTNFVGNTMIKYNKVTNYATASRYGFGITDEVGAYYFFGVQNSVIANNYAEYCGNKPIDGCFREDQGGLNIRFVNNVADCKSSVKSFSFHGDMQTNILFDNNYSNVPDKFSNISGSTVTNFHLEANAPYTTKWSAAAQSIIDSAGLQKPYQYLLSGFGKDVYDTSAMPSIAKIAWSDALQSFIKNAKHPIAKDLNLFWVPFSHGSDLTKQNNIISIKNAKQSTKVIFRGAYYGNDTIRFHALFNDSINTHKEISFRMANLAYRNIPRYYFWFSDKVLNLRRVNADLSTTTLIGTKGTISETIKYTSNLYTTGSDVEIYTNNEANGVHITLTIDGVKIVECLDTKPGYLTNPGFLMFESRGAGGFILLSNPNEGIK